MICRFLFKGKWLLFTFIFAFLVQVHSQQKGESALIYRAHENFINHDSSTADLRVIKRSPRDIFMSGGGDYIVIPMDNSFKKQFKKELWGIEQGDSLFINNYYYLKVKGYSKVLYRSKGMLYFRGPIAALADTRDQIGLTAYLAGGPVLGGILNGKAAQRRFNYVISLNNNQVFLLDKRKMLEILVNNKQLYYQYQAEKEPEDEEILHTYFQRMDRD